MVVAGTVSCSAAGKDHKAQRPHRQGAFSPSLCIGFPENSVIMQKEFCLKCSYLSYAGIRNKISHMDRPCSWSLSLPIYTSACSSGHCRHFILIPTVIIGSHRILLMWPCNQKLVIILNHFISHFGFSIVKFSLTVPTEYIQFYVMLHIYVIHQKCQREYKNMLQVFQNWN